MPPPDLAGPVPGPAGATVAGRPRWRPAVLGATLVVGTALLAATLRAPKGSLLFAALGLGLAATWTAGALLAGPVPVRPAAPARWSTVTLWGLAIGAVAFAGSWATVALGQYLPVLADALDEALGPAEGGSDAVVLVVAVVNGVAEELFFRGSLHAALPHRRRLLTATALYVLVTAATANVALVLAAVVMGTIFTIERALTGSILASTVTHVSWSALVLLALPG